MFCPVRCPFSLSYISVWTLSHRRELSMFSSHCLHARVTFQCFIFSQKYLQSFLLSTGQISCRLNEETTCRMVPVIDSASRLLRSIPSNTLFAAFWMERSGLILVPLINSHSTWSAKCQVVAICSFLFVTFTVCCTVYKMNT